MDEIIRRLRNRDKKSLNYLKESMLVEEKLLEKDEDEEEEIPPIEDEEVVDDIPDDIDNPSEEEKPADDAAVEDEEEVAPDDSEIDTSEDDGEEHEEYVNPLDNKYAVRHKIGHQVVLTYANGTKTKITGVIDGYDKEGFYRVKWSNGKTMNGITDIALSSMIEYTEESKCVCGSTEFVTEGDKTVCDSCGRHIKESTDPLTLADKSRPKGRRMIRSEAHPISTALSEDVSDGGYAILYRYDGDELSDYQSTVIVKAPDEETAIEIAKKKRPTGRHFELDTTVGDKGYISSISAWKSANPRSNFKIYEECATKRTIQDSIRNAFKTKKLKEEVEDISFAKLEKALSGEFWTRKSEMVADIVAEGFDVPDYNDEYVVVSIGEDEEDEEYKEFLIPIGGTIRTMTLDFNRAREL